MLPERSVLIGQKLAENAKVQKFKCDIFDDFQTVWNLPVDLKLELFEWDVCYLTEKSQKYLKKVLKIADVVQK